MQIPHTAIADLLHSFSSETITEIQPIPQSGGDRNYFRVRTPATSYIATASNNIRENDAFLAFSAHFKTIDSPVPSILALNEERNLYLQEDVGETSLLAVLEQRGHSDEVYQLFQQSLSALARMQINGDKGFDYQLCITSREFGKQAILSDLLYYKYYFLDTLKIPYDKELFLAEADALSTYLSEADERHFMYRDFQSRNILVNEGKVFFIDYQGGMKGALQYDVASLLWQAKAELPESWKNSLLQFYMNEVNQLLQHPLERSRFENQYHGYVLIRLLQVLGAYGFRGLFERKAHFLTSIPLALKNLKSFLQLHPIDLEIPEFNRLLAAITHEDIIQRFQPILANTDTPLKVVINSFSYKKGIPEDESNHGGGFVFDCRGILNPGRFDAYKKLSGLDQPVKDFLEQETEMPAFLNNIYNILNITVTDYLKRDFDHLMINFGCTGGQHRSVFASEAVARHLRNQFRLSVTVNHLNQNNWVR